MPAADAGERVRPGRAGKAHRRCRRVLFVVGVKNEDLVHGLGDDGVDLEFLGWNGKAHVQKILRVAQAVVRVVERLAKRVFVGHRRQRGQFGDEAPRGDHALHRIMDVGGIVIEGRKRADDAAHDCHGMGVAPESAQKRRELLMHHGVSGDGTVEFLLLRGVRKFALKKKIGDLQKNRLSRQVPRLDSRDEEERPCRRRCRSAWKYMTR